MSAIAYNQPSWLHAQVQGGYPTIVHRKMSSFFDARGRRKKKDNDLSITISRLVRALIENPIPCCAFYYMLSYCSSFFRSSTCFTPTKSISHEDIYSSKSNTWSVQLSPINRIKPVLRGELIFRDRKYLFLSVFFSLWNLAKFFTTDGYTMFQSK